jgi:hypothetical protein
MIVDNSVITPHLQAVIAVADSTASQAAKSTFSNGSKTGVA